MQYIMMLKADEQSEAGVLRDPAKMAGVGNLVEEMASSGVLVSTAGLKPSSTGVRVKFSQGERTITDGPFAESKELIAGFVIIQVDTMADALGWADRFAEAHGDCESEIRPLFDESDFAVEA